MNDWWRALPLRRGMLKYLLPALALLALLPGTAAAQQQPLDPSFSNEVLSTYDLPEIDIVQSDNGFSAPNQVAAGRYLVALTSAAGFFAYLDLVQQPAGLSPENAGQQLLSAARDDMPVPGWTYGGGTYAVDGRTAWVVLDLMPGEWTWGLTSQPMAGDAEEVPYLLPLTVTESTAAASTTEIAPAVDVTLSEFAFQGLESATLPDGPQVWRFTNQGSQAHHMVLYRTPELVTPDDVQVLLDAFMSATPTPPPSWWTEAVWVGYEAMISPGQSIVTEYDLAPGTYLALCFVADANSGMPHVAEGMTQGFTVGGTTAGTPSA